MLVLGAHGMLGSEVARFLSHDERYQVYASTQRDTPPVLLAEHAVEIIPNIDALNESNIVSALLRAQPDVVINCIGAIKQKPVAHDQARAIALNAMLPHRLADLTRLARARLVHVSTDCVFSGRSGAYTETDPPDALDLYGITKYLGEVNAQHALTLRTSIIGHEVGTRHGLVEWFLSSQETVKGFSKAFFSGLPTVEFARLLADHVLPNSDVSGLFHLSSEPISKLELLQLIKKEYGVQTEIEPDNSVSIDRSLNSTRFRERFKYIPPSWPDLIRSMHAGSQNRKMES